MTPSSPAELVAFALFAVLALVSAVAVVWFRNPIRSAVGLFVHVISLAGLYITLSAHFLVAVQLIVYVGAVVVLFVFVIMLLGPDAERPSDDTGRLPRVLGSASVAAVGVLLAITLAGVKVARPPRVESFGTIREIGQVLFDKSMIPFEFASVLLTVAVVGAFAVARTQQNTKRKIAAGTDDEAKGGEAS